MRRPPQQTRAFADGDGRAGRIIERLFGEFGSKRELRWCAGWSENPCVAPATKDR